MSNFSYTASGGISQMKLGNRRWETAKFNDRMQVTELGLGNSATDAGVWKTNYEYGELQTNGTVDMSKNRLKQRYLMPSDSDSFSVEIEDCFGKIVPAILKLSLRSPFGESRRLCALQLRIPETSQVFESTSNNFFDAMIKIRKRLDSDGVKLLCVGARKDAWSSGMQRDMGAGKVAYLLNSVDQNNLIESSIFDYAPSELIGTTDEQLRYFLDWCEAKLGK